METEIPLPFFFIGAMVIYLIWFALWTLRKTEEEFDGIGDYNRRNRRFKGAGDYVPKNRSETPPESRSDWE